MKYLLISSERITEPDRQAYENQGERCRSPDIINDDDPDFASEFNSIIKENLKDSNWFFFSLLSTSSPSWRTCTPESTKFMDKKRDILSNLS